MPLKLKPKPPCFCCGAKFKGPRGTEYPWPCKCIDHEICGRCLKCKPHCACDGGFFGSGEDLRQLSERIKGVRL